MQKLPNQLLLCLLLFSVKTNAQIKEENVTSNFSNVRYKIGGAIEKLAKEKTYKIVSTGKSSYIPNPETKQFWEGITLNMDAKRITDGSATDKTFEIETQGLIPLNKFEDVKYPLATNKNENGFIRKVYYKFPLKIIVKNNLGVKEKELILHDDNYECSVLYHANTLTEDINKSIGDRPKISFTTKDELEKSYSINKAAIEKILERNEMISLRNSAIKAIYAGYDFNSFLKQTVYYYNVKKGKKDDFLSMFENADKLGYAIKDFAEPEKEAAALETLKTSYAYYKEQIANKANFTPETVKMCLFNGALAAMESGNMEDANSWFSDYYSNYWSTNDIGRIIDDANTLNFTNLYPMFNAYYSIKNSNSSNIIIGNNYTFYDDYAIERGKKLDVRNGAASVAEAQAKANNPNIKDEDGYVVFEDGEKVEGKVTYYFYEEAPSGGIVDLDKREIIKPYNASQMTKAKRKVSYFFAKGTRYEAVAIKESSVMGMLGKMSNPGGMLAKKEFYKVYYTIGNYTVYQNPLDANSFAIKKVGDEKAVHVKDIYEDKKSAKSFIENCPALNQKIDAKDKFTDMTDVKMFADFLNTNCK